MSRRSLVVVAAGLSRPSSTRLLADQLAAAAGGRADLDVTVIELRDLAHGIADHLLTGFPPAELKHALHQVAAADGLIAVSPIFTATYSGLFKSFFDLVDKDALSDKPVLIAATAGTARHSLALEHAMRPMFAYLRAAVVPTAVFAASDDWGAESADGTVRARIDRGAAELVREMERRAPVAVTDPFALTATFEELLRS